MRIKTQIACLMVLLSAVSCRELPAYFKGGAPLAKVGHKTLYLHEVERLAPEGISGDDSAAFYRLCVDRWVSRQIKLNEAGRIFPEEELADVEEMVEEYRQLLLIRKLDHYCVDRAIDTVFTDEAIQSYYNTHLSDFKSDRTLVKGRILRLPDGERQTKKLLALMRAPGLESRKDLEDICTKQGFRFENLSAEWVEWDEFLSRLPVLRDQDYSSLLASSDIQQMRDNRSNYYFQLTSVRHAGEALPLERVRETIRRILFNQRQGELIRDYERTLREDAEEQGRLKIYYENETEEQVSE